jgi:hypothetical protein
LIVDSASYEALYFVMMIAYSAADIIIYHILLEEAA